MTAVSDELEVEEIDTAPVVRASARLSWFRVKEHKMPDLAQFKSRLNGGMPDLFHWLSAFECAWRTLAYKYAKELQPFPLQQPLRDPESSHGPSWERRPPP